MEPEPQEETTPTWKPKEPHCAWCQRRLSDVPCVAHQHREAYARKHQGPNTQVD